jgi:hypothetical protein
LFSRRVISASAPGMAAEHSPQGFPRTAKGSVFIDCVYGVLAARGGKPALAAEKLAQRSAVNNHELDEEPAHKCYGILGPARDQC